MAPAGCRMGGARGRPVWRRGVGLATKVDDVRSNHPNLTLAHDSRKLRQFWGTVLVKYSWCVRTRRRSLCVAMDRAIDRGRIASASDAVEGGEEADPSRPSSRASSGGRVSPALESDMENIAWDELPLEKIYEYFAHATHLVGIVRAFEALKTKLGLDGVHGLRLFRSLKEKLSSQKTWKARDVLQMLDKRANQQEYMRQKAAEGVSVMIVGGGPVGLRLAIDCLLLGCEVRLIEKRSSFSRNNVLHLWPFTIEDLRQLGAKKFHGKFCAGAIDHICIRSLQCILLKMCLLLGLSFHFGVEFREVLEPTADRGWHAKLNPSDHFLNEFDFDFLVGADGRRSTVPGFDRKELRGKLALAITANFINYCTRDEAAVDEISGVAFIFNQKFFKDLRSETGIDLENIVYYKDDTHYFVMTAKKDSLLKKGVLLADHHDTHTLLHPSNINKEELYDYALEAAGWSTELPHLDFAVNHYDEPDVALFDFTSIFQAEYAARAVRKRGRDLTLSVVGDALLEPFWPTGTGLARGFLSAQDTAWMIRGFGQGRKMLDLLCEREVISQRLPQTTPERLQSNIKTYTINPLTRYCNLHLRKLPLSTVKHLYDTDTVAISPSLQRGSIKLKSVTSSPVTVSIGDSTEDKENAVPQSPSLAVSEAPPLVSSPSRTPLAEGSINLAYYSEPDNKMSLSRPILLQWVKSHIEECGIQVNDLSTSWSNGLALCALIHRFHPELIPEFHSLTPDNPVHNNQRAFSIAEESFNISPLLQPTEMETPDHLAVFTYLSLFYEFFADVEPGQLGSGRPQKATVPQLTPTKRKTAVMIAPTPQSVERSWNTRTVKRRSLSPPPVATTLSNGHHDDHLVAEPPKKKINTQPKPVKRAGHQFAAMATTNSSDMCCFCNKRVYLMERMSANGFFFHRTCFRCSHCNCQLKIGGYSLSKGDRAGEKGKFFCTPHYRQLFLSNPEAINYSRVGQGRREKGAGEEEPMEAGEHSETMGLVRPSSKLDKLVEMDEHSMEIVAEPVSVMDIEPLLESPVVINIQPPLAVGEGERGGKEGQKRQISNKKKSEKKNKEADKEKRKEEEEREAGREMGSADQQVVCSMEKTVTSVTERETGGVGRERKRKSARVIESGGRNVVEEGGRRERRNTLLSGEREGRERRERGGVCVRQLSSPVRTRAEWEVIERELEIEMEQSVLQVQTNVSGRVSFTKRIRAPSTVQQLTATYERKEREKDEQSSNSLVRASRLLNVNKYRSRGGQKSIVRPMRITSTLEHSDVMIQEHRKQQRRFREAQSIQREMSQLERQHEEMEDVGREIELALRDAEGTSQEDRFMQAWLQLVNERNGLVRKITELSLRVKELELEDQQYEVDKELNELFTIPDDNQTVSQKQRFEELFEQKLALVEDRDELVIQIDEDRKREQEEDVCTTNLLEGIRRDSVISRSSAGSDYSPGSMTRVLSAPNVRYNKEHDVIEEERSLDEEAESVEAVLLRDKKAGRTSSRIKTWFGFSK